MPNPMASETSPYLLQHANNPWIVRVLQQVRAAAAPLASRLGIARQSGFVSLSSSASAANEGPAVLDR